MKKLMLLWITMAIPAFLFAQSSADRIFEKYAGKEGLTTVVVNKGMFKMLSKIDEEDEDLQTLAAIESVKILVVEEDGVLEGVNFYDEVMEDLNTAEYEELMTVKESDQDVKILVKEKEGIIEELLVLTGGSKSDDNAIIIIRGRIPLKDLHHLSGTMDIDHLEVLEELEANK